MEHEKCVCVCLCWYYHHHKHSPVDFINWVADRESEEDENRKHEYQNCWRGEEEKRNRPTHTHTSVNSIDKFSLKMMHVFIYAINLFVRLWHMQHREYLNSFQICACTRVSEFWYTLTAWLQNISKMQLQLQCILNIRDDDKFFFGRCRCCNNVTCIANSCIIASSGILKYIRFIQSIA